MTRHDRILDQLRREHRASIEQTVAGWTWSCSCGKRGMGRARMVGYAEKARAQHLRAAERKIAEATR